ncbi:MAG: LysR family transcriptional regulator [Shimia sp.]
MDNWDDLRFLVAVARAGTMTAAARALGTNTATVSRRIERLGESLGAPPFAKTRNGWVPSDHVAGLIELATTFEGNLASQLHTPDQADGRRIPISIGAPPIIAAEYLIPGLAQAQEVQERLTVTFNDRIFREGLGENDIVVSYGAPDHGRVRTRKAGTVPFNLWRHTDANDDGRWVGLTEEHDPYPSNQMGFEAYGGPPAMRADSFRAVLDLMLQLKLPACLPDVVAARYPQLALVETSLSPFEAQFWVFYHESRKGDPAIDCAIRWIVSCFEAPVVVPSARIRAVGG